MGENSKPISDMTPPEVDQELADLSGEQAKVEQQIVWTVDTLHRMVGDRKVRQYSDRADGGKWGLTFAEVIDSADKVASYDKRKWYEQIDGLKELRADAARIDSEIAVRNAEWARRGCWSRFFLVLNNNGHIHRSLTCSTCFWDTSFAWLPQLSGLTEADAVADQGEILCTVCFPSAPSAWTSGISKATKAAKDQRAVEKAERAAKKLAKALLPDGSELVVERSSGWTERISSLAAAKMFLTDQYRWRRDGNPSTRTVAEAVAAKTGDTVDQVLEVARKRANKNR